MLTAVAFAQAQAAGGGDDGIPAQIVAAIIAAAASLLVLAITNWANSQREKDTRRRDMYAKAFAAVAAYKEFPYVVRRRRQGDGDVAASERVRISEALRLVQQDLSYYSAWMATESGRVACAYRALVAETRRVAGEQIHLAWTTPAPSRDEDMNMPELGLAQLASAETVFLDTVAGHLSWWPHRRWRRGEVNPEGESAA